MAGMFGSVDVAVRFIADASSVEAESNKVAGVGNKLVGWAKIAGGAIAGAFIVDKVKDFVGAAEEAEVASARLATTLRNAGDTSGAWAAHAENLSNTLMNQTGIDDEVIKGGQAILATFHTLGGEVGQTGGYFDRATQAALDLSKAGFGSVDSASTMLGKALEDPTKGLTALRRVGVNFTEDQQKLIKGFVESGDKAGAMNAILSNVEGQVGGVSQATATAGDKMKVAWGETQESLGKMLLPALEKLAPLVQSASVWVQDHLVPAIGDLVGWIADHKDDIASFFQPFVDAIKTVVPALIDLGKVIAEKVQPVLSAIGQWVNDHKDIFPAIAIAITTMLVPAFVAWAISAATAAAATIAAAAPFILLGAAITAIAYLIISNWDTIKAATLAVWNFILDVIHGVWDWITNNWMLLLGIILGPFGLAVGLVIKYWDDILNFIKQVPGWIAGFLSTVGEIITWPFRWAWDQIVNIYNGIKGFFAQIPGWIGSALSSLGGIILQPFQWAWDQIINIKDKIMGIGSAIVDGLKSPWNSFANWFNGLDISIGGWDMPGPIPDVPKITLPLPHLPTFATGGITTQEGLAWLHPNEAVIPLNGTGTSRAASLVHIENASFQDPVDLTLFMRQVAWAAQTERI